MMNRTSWIGVVALALAACGGDKDARDDQSPPAPPEAAKEPAAPEQEPAASRAVRVEGVELATPESVLHVPGEDVYLVSNINGAPLEADGNGFISKFGPDGAVVALKWIDGAAEGVELSAPKGMAIRNGTLYVTDIDAVRMFDATTGAPKGAIEVAGATFLNDLAVAGDRLYLSDTGMKAGEGGFEPSGSAAVYAIASDDKLEKLAAGEQLGNPNGLAAADDGVWVVTFGGNELYRIDAAGNKTDVTTLPKGQLDGLEMTAAGDFLISSWEGKAVYRGRPGGTFAPVIEDVESPADIGWDRKRQRVLIPVFTGDALVLHPLG